MNTRQKLEKIKVILGMKKSPKNFAESALQDGTIVSYDELQVGYILYIKTDEETTVPAPAGEYTLEDGTIVVTDESGLITEIKEPEAEDTEMEIDEALEARLTSIEDRLKIIEEALGILTETVEEVEDTITEIEETSDEFKKEFKTKMSKIPGAKPIYKTTPKQDEKPLTTAEKRINVLKNLK